jgi:hypothetical protein
MSHASVARQEWGPRPVTRVKKAGTLLPRVVRAIVLSIIGAVLLAFVGALMVRVLVRRH